MRLLVAFLLFLPGASAVVWEDPPGDHEIGTADVWAPAPAGQYQVGDVLRVEMTELDARRIHMEAEVADLDSAGPVDHNGVQFGVRAVGDALNRTWGFVESPDGFWLLFGRSEWIDGADGPEQTARWLVGGPAQREGNVVSGSLPKGTFTAEGHGPSIFLDPGPRAGDSVRLAPWSGHFSGVRFGNYVDVRDLLGAPQDFLFAIEAERRGDVHLFVERPFRGSNGAATTYLYDISARNEGTQDHVVHISVSAPRDWIARAPAEVEVPAGQTIVFPVAISVPFAHKHGHSASASIQAEAGDGSLSSADVHVYWHDPPQPGGHHPIVSLKDELYPYFDTGPSPDAGTVAPHDESTGTGPMRDMVSTWRFGLRPSRTIGLDFDSAGAVTGHAAFELDEASDIRLTGRLLLSDGAIIAEQVHNASWDVGIHEVAWRMPILPGVDRFPPDQGGNLVFEFVLEHTVLDPSAGTYGSWPQRVRLHLQDNRFELPLSDYHEQIDLASVGIARLSLHTPEAARIVNPEELIVIPFEVRNHDISARRLAWTLDTSADWIAMHGAPERLGPGENATFQVVAAPGQLPDGTVAQVLVVARDVETGIESFGRVAVTVTTGQDAPNESYLAGGSDGPEQDSPFPLAVVLMALLVMRRR